MATIPKAANGAALLGASPKQTPLESTYNASLAASVEITLQSAATMIEVAAMAKAVLIRWGTADASTTDFDAVIPADSVRQFAVPRGATAINLIEQAASAAVAVTEFA